jgi:ABC-2 type transport system permease protein
MINFYIKILFLLRPIFLGLGVNFEQIVAIVEVKLKIDNRRARFNQWNKKQSESNGTFFLMLGLYFLMACAISAFIYFSASIIAIYSLIFAVMMFMLAMTLITDFSAVILDSNDNAILLPRPIDDRTLLIARITHILMYLLSMMLALAIPFLVVTMHLYGVLAAISFLLISLLSLILIVFLTNIFYLVLMKFTSEERLRNIINTFQIVLTVIFMGGYRLVGRMVNFDALINGVDSKVHWWHFLVPPIWMGNCMNIIIKHEFDSTKFLFLFLTLTVPFMVVFLVNNGFSGVFNQKIAGMDIAKRQEKIPNKTSKKGLVETLSSIFTGTSMERGTFEFVWKITSRDRKFKLRIYPSLAYLLIYPVFMIGTGRGDGSFVQQIEHLRESTGMGIVVIYLCGTVLLTIRSQISQSEDFKAAWLYELAPIGKPGEILSGSLRAIMVKFLLPITLLLSLVLSVIWGVNLLDDLLFGMLTIINLELLLSIGMSNELPFSTEIKKNGGGSFIRNMTYFFITGIIGFIHYLMMQVPYVIGVFMVIQLALALFLFKKYREVAWEKVRME